MLLIDSFFSGIGGIELGFERTGKFKTIYANEIDKFACQTYNANHSISVDNRSIYDVLDTDIPDCDVMVGGFPCQTFSVAGNRKGFDDPRGVLFFEMLRLIKAKRPKIVFFENVKHLLNHNGGNTFKTILKALADIGYYVKYDVLNARDYNVPQNRERLYIVGFLDKKACDNFEFPGKVKLISRLSSAISFKDIVDEKYYYTPDTCKYYFELEKNIKDIGRIYQWRRYYVRAGSTKYAPTLTANMGTGGGNVPLILDIDESIRKLTPRECLNLQGYSRNFVLPKSVSNSQLYKQIGNSVCVPVIKLIADNIFKAIS